MKRRRFIGRLAIGLVAIGLGKIISLIPVLKKRCVWNMDTPCNGEVKTELMFDNQLEVPICKSHLHEHHEVMGCHKYGLDIEKIIRWNISTRRKIMRRLDIPLGKA